MLAHQVLDEIPDAEVLGNLTNIRSQLDDLIGNTNLHLLRGSHTAQVDIVSTGKELKDALSLLTEDEQLELLQKYNNSVKAAKTNNSYVSDKERDETHIKHFMIKGTFKLFTGIIFIGGAAVLVETYKTGKMPVDALVSLINPVFEFLKVLVP